MDDKSTPSSDHRVATIYDVARLAQVSRQTVSNVVNGRTSRTMKAATRDRVLEAIEKLDYHPDVNATRLSRRRTQTIAILILDPSPHFLADAFTAQMVSGIASLARTRGYSVLLNTFVPGGGSDSVIRVLVHREADGLIVIPSGQTEEWSDILGAIGDTKRPFVAVQSPTELPAAGLTHGASIRADDYGGGYACGRLLIELGHRRVVFLSTAVRWPAVEQRRSGLERSLQEAHAEHPEVVVADEYSVSRARIATSALFHQPQPESTALVAANDVLAAGALAAALEAGVRVPENFSIIGFDDLDIAVGVTPALTTVRVPAYEMGAAAAAELLRVLQEPEAKPAAQVFPTTLVVRQSTGAAPL